MSLLRERLLTAAVASTLSLPGCGGEQSAYDLAFISHLGGGGFDAYLTTVGSGEFRRLSAAPGNLYSLAWSPDGQRLVFTAAGDSATGDDVFVMNADGTRRRNLTTSPGSDTGGSWTPDGARIVFTSRRHAPDGPPSQDELYIMNAEGGDVRRLTTNDVGESAPRVSPDGSRIAFCRAFPRPAGGRGSDVAIMVSDLTGDDATRLTFTRGADCQPDWSPDGSRIAFHRCRESTCQIHVMRRDGTRLQPLTDAPYDNRRPRWSPDGALIAYTSVRPDGTAIWIMRADGTERRSLTALPGNAAAAEWRPVGPS